MGDREWRPPQISVLRVDLKIGMGKGTRGRIPYESTLTKQELHDSSPEQQGVITFVVPCASGLHFAADSEQPANHFVMQKP
jgi:hypothetical protein